MRKVWVLDTSTKGTGASVVPLERAGEKGERKAEPPRPVYRRAEPAGPAEPEAPPVRAFRVVDLLTDRVLADEATAREAVRALEAVRSTVDVRVYVREGEDGAWRLLTLREQRALWELRGRDRA